MLPPAPHSSAWLAIRRPLLVAFVFGCAISLMTSGRLSLRLVAPATLYSSFVPLLEIAGLAVVWPWRQSPLSFARAIDLFFVSHTPWSLWLCAFAAVTPGAAWPSPRIPSAVCGPPSIPKPWPRSTPPKSCSPSSTVTVTAPAN
jgi:hypothetical protein